MAKRMGATKTEKVLVHLQKHGSITSIEAIELYSNTRLAATIHYLKSKGYIIESAERVHCDKYGDDSTYTKYVYGGMKNE